MIENSLKKSRNKVEKRWGVKKAKSKNKKIIHKLAQKNLC